MAYSYVRSGGNLSLEHRARSVRNAKVASAARLDPDDRDVDSLIFQHRRPILEAWLEQLPGQLNVLDVGGRIQPYRGLIETKIRGYFALDLQFEGMVDVVATAEHIPLRNDCLDLVLCTDTLQYIPDPGAAINEMHRVLKPGGQLLLSTRGCYPEHHDELWRFLPDGLRRLAHRFSKVEVMPEGATGSGVMTTINVLLHRSLEETRWGRIARRTSVPLLNRLGRVLDRISPHDTRSACGISVRAIK